MQHWPETITPELRLLLLCARKTLPPSYHDRIVKLLQAPLDWKLFLHLVDGHQVAPLVWRSLQTTSDLPLPAELQSALRQRVEANAWSVLALAAELARLVRRLEQAGIRVIPFKGPVLALTAYGSLALRQGGDLDLLVDPARFQEAEGILLQAGYARLVPAGELSPAQTAAHFKIGHHSTYKHSTQGIIVELHWQWIRNPLLFPLSFEEAWQKRLPLTVGGVTMAILPVEELLLYLCAHGAEFEWSYLKCLCDIPELLAMTPGIGLEQVITRAKQLGVSRMLAQGVLLAHEMLDTPLPPAIAALAQQDPIIPTLVKRARLALLQGCPFWKDSVGRQLAHLPYRLKLRPEFAYKWRCVYCFSLRTEDYAVIRLPDRLFPLYFLLRPFIWAFRQLQRRRRQSSR